MGTTTDKRRFGGIERVYGPTAAQAFTRLHVTIVGMGGVGSWAVESLARAGVGKLTLVDGDVSEEEQYEPPVSRHSGELRPLES